MKILKPILMVAIPLLLVALFIPFSGNSYPDDAVYISEETTAKLLSLYDGNIDEVTTALRACAGEEAKVDKDGSEIVVHSFSSANRRDAFLIWMYNIESLQEDGLEVEETTLEPE